MKEQKIVHGPWTRRLIKAIFIIVALGLLIIPLWSVELREIRDTYSAVIGFFSVVCGLVFSSRFAIIARSAVRIPSPSKKALIIVSVSCVIGYFVGTWLSKLILRLAFGMGAFVGVLAIIGGVISYIFAYSAGIFTVLGNSMATVYSMILGSEELPDNLKGRNEEEDEWNRAILAQAAADVEKWENSDRK